MSFISRIKEHSNPVSSSDLDSCDESFLRSRDSFSSSHMKQFGKTPRPTPVKEFKQSLEHEKNIRQLMGRLDSLDITPTIGNEKIVDVLERNYKLQIQTLLEEVNKLKLEKKLTEKKMEIIEKNSVILDKSKRGSELNSTFEDASWKMTLESKNSTIKELEFQVSQFKKENSTLKTRLEAQIKQIDELFQRLADSENLKDILEEKEQEIAELKDMLEAEEAKNEKLLQELSYIKNENITLKLKSQNNSFTLLPTGATSFLNGQCTCSSKDQSFLSVLDKNGHYRANSDNKFLIGGVLNFSDINEDTRTGSTHPSLHCRKASMYLTRGMKEQNEGDSNESKRELSLLRNMSVKVLSDYEKEVKNETKMNVKNDSKTLDRIIEVNKIKSYYIEAQNKKLLDLINGGKTKEEDSNENLDNS